MAAKTPRQQHKCVPNNLQAAGCGKLVQQIPLCPHLSLWCPVKCAERSEHSCLAQCGTCQVLRGPVQQMPDEELSHRLRVPALPTASFPASLHGWVLANRPRSQTAQQLQWLLQCWHSVGGGVNMYPLTELQAEPACCPSKCHGCLQQAAALLVHAAGLASWVLSPPVRAMPPAGWPPMHLPLQTCPKAAVMHAASLLPPHLWHPADCHCCLRDAEMTTKDSWLPDRSLPSPSGAPWYAAHMYDTLWMAELINDNSW